MPTIHPVGLHPGATWRRIDLQCHTPRDRAWHGPDVLPGGTEELEEARRGWAARFVEACLAKGLTLVAITDHHDVAFVPTVREAARARGGLVVLPGIEITTEDGVQCLALFDPDTELSIWTRLLMKLRTVTAAGDAEAKTAPIGECGLSLEQLFEVVREDGVLSGPVLLIPHFGNETAHKSLNRIDFAPRAKSLPYDGVYIECPYSELTQTTLDKIQGRIPAWGTKRRAILATGDNRRADFYRLGLHACWVKIGEDSVEALRQAFLADEVRISYAEPEIPSERIVEVEILSTLTGAQPLRLSFNAGFTALIGGRGSGKSAVLEYLRFGLGKSEADIVADEKRRRERETSLIDETLRDGWVRVTLDREGVREVWFRAGNRPEDIVATLQDGREEIRTVAEAQRFFPARAFHQRELSTPCSIPQPPPTTSPASPLRRS